MEKNKKYGLLLLVIIVVGIIGFVVYQKLTKDEIGDNSGSDQEENLDANVLSNEELETFKAFFNQKGINAFTRQEYENVTDIDLYHLLYDGIGKDDEEDVREEEFEDYLKAIGADHVEIEVFKISDQSLSEFLKKNANLDHVKGETIERLIEGYSVQLTYLPKYDSYYIQHGDTNYAPVDSCFSGTYKNNVYTIKCGDPLSWYYQVVLEKQEDHYIFVSNKFVRL